MCSETRRRRCPESEVRLARDLLIKLAQTMVCCHASHPAQNPSEPSRQKVNVTLKHNCTRSTHFEEIHKKPNVSSKETLRWSMVSLRYPLWLVSNTLSRTVSQGCVLEVDRVACDVAHAMVRNRRSRGRPSLPLRYMVWIDTMAV